MRIIMLILAALVVASGTGFYVLQGLQEPVQPVATAAVDAPRSVEVYVPAVELAAGSIITPENLSSMPIADSAVTAEMVRAGDDGALVLVGSVARQLLHKGVPIAKSAVVQPGERGFLAAVLPKGKRAISIPISETAGISGLVLPGDRVDIILTYSVSGESIEAARDIRASETMMTNIRVLALDQRLQGAKPAVQENGTKVVTPIARTATLEVTPQQAEMMTLATNLGELSLVLNSIRDGGTPEEMQIASAQDASTGSMAANRPRPDAGPMAATLRHMTLDSDVTSLLQRELMSRQGSAPTDGALLPPAAKGDSLVPLDDRIIRVQIVRGSANGGANISPGPANTPTSLEGAVPATPAE